MGATPTAASARRQPAPLFIVMLELPAYTYGGS